jgi:hypothetical protein
LGIAEASRRAVRVSIDFAVMGGAGTKPGFVVLRQVGKDTWQLVGEAYRVVLRSEWRIAAE